MISIIVCSRKSYIPLQLRTNIGETIGLDYELVIIDNSKNQYTIFEAYNLGVSRSKYPYLCFMHDDLLYHTKDWGVKMIQHFQDNEVGVVGVGGCHYLSKYPISLLSWEIAIRNKMYSFNYIQNSIENKTHKSKLYNNLEKESVDAVALDGMWFCIKRDLFEHTDLKFDEQNFKGFHFYDFDICMQVHALGKKAIIISDILIEHFSTGTFDKIWYDNAFKFYKKWKKYLPICIGLKLPEDEIKDLEYNLVMEFIKSSIELQENLSNQIQSVRKSKKYRLGRFLLLPISWLKQ